MQRPKRTHEFIISRESHESRKILLYAFGGIGVICVSKNLGRCTQTSLHSRNSLLAAQNVLLSKNESSSHSPHLSKNKKRGFWGEEEKCERFQHSYNQVDTNKRNNSRKHTKKDLSVFGVLLKSFCGNT